MVRRRSRGPDPVDVHVGNRLRFRRMVCGMSQGALGEHLGLTYQQIQKYENGHNRIAASRLYRFAGILAVPVSFFFGGLPETVVQAHPTGNVQNTASGGCRSSGSDIDRHASRVVANYCSIQDRRVRNSIASLMRAIGKNSNNTQGTRSN